MQEFYDQSFEYENQTPQKQPGGFRDILSRYGLYVGIGLIVIAVVIVLVFALRGNTPETTEERVERENMIAQVIDACSDAENKEVCEADARSELAQETGNARYCDGLSSEFKDTCLLYAALSSNDPAICSDISGSEAKERCIIDVVASIPSNQMTQELCGLLPNEEKESCLLVLNESYLLTDACPSYFDADVCTSAGMIHTAIDARNPDLCSEATYAGHSEFCLELTLPGDRDFDGLNATDEAFYGTEDTNPDSDGDGLLDGEEVQVYGSDPLAIDSDDDGISDYDEVAVYKSDPASSDTDGDGFTDGTEVEFGYDPSGPGVL